MDKKRADKRKKDKGKKDVTVKKRSDFVAFLKKRAPIYLGIVALFVVFVVPSLTAKSLDDTFPDFTEEEQGVVDVLMGYDGGDGTGLTVLEAIEKKIGEEYPDGNIYDDKKTIVGLTVERTVGDDLPDDEVYRVVLDFEAKNGQMEYSWNVDMVSGNIVANNPDARHALELVQFYD